LPDAWLGNTPIILLIEECNVRAWNWSPHANGPATPEDELLLQVQGVVVGEYERAKILERSRVASKHGARCGCIHVLGGAPYGYRYVRKQEGGGAARYEIVAEEAQRVQQNVCLGGARALVAQ